MSGLFFDDRLQLSHESLQVLRGELGVRGAGALLELVERAVQLLSGDAEDDAAVHLHEAPVGVEGEALVVGLLGEPLDGAVVEAEVQDRVHHARHRELRPGADRDQERVVGVAEAAPHTLLEPVQVLSNLCVEPVRPTGAHVGAAGVGRDREAVGNRQPEHRGHLGQVGTLPTEKVLELHRGTRVLVVEVVHVAHEGLLELSLEPA